MLVQKSVENGGNQEKIKEELKSSEIPAVISDKTNPSLTSQLDNEADVSICQTASLSCNTLIKTEEIRVKCVSQKVLIDKCLERVWPEIMGGIVSGQSSSVNMAQRHDPYGCLIQNFVRYSGQGTKYSNTKYQDY